MRSSRRHPQPGVTRLVDGELDRAVEALAGPVDLPGQRPCLGQPEGAQQEGALLAGEAVDALVGAVAGDQSAGAGETRRPSPRSRSAMASMVASMQASSAPSPRPDASSVR